MNHHDRYLRQEKVAGFGGEGQARLRSASVLVIGCGGLGCAQAQLLARAGVGRLVLVDRDVVELSNIHRQILFDEDDAAAALFKVEAAARKLKRINSTVDIEAKVLQVGAQNIVDLLDGIDLVLDATDNAPARYIINDACVKQNKPWIYGGVVGTEGTVMAVVPSTGPCLRCLFEDPPAPGTLPTCNTHGVLNVGPLVTASLQVTEAFKLLAGCESAPKVTFFNLWSQSFRAVAVPKNPDCVCCGQRQFSFLEAGEKRS